MEWKEQYRHPLWQRKRLEMLEAADFTCQRCASKETHLHVHHKHYVKGRMIWEYEKYELEVLCEPCHDEAHADKNMLQEILSSIPTGAIPDITFLVFGFCCHIKGPARLDYENLDVGPSRFSNLRGYEVGRAAAAICNLGETLSLEELQSLTNALERYESFPGQAPKIIFDLGNKDQGIYP